jgi:hypothetical protein
MFEMKLLGYIPLYQQRSLEVTLRQPEQFVSASLNTRNVITDFAVSTNGAIHSILNGLHNLPLLTI